MKGESKSVLHKAAPRPSNSHSDKYWSKLRNLEKLLYHVSGIRPGLFLVPTELARDGGDVPTYIVCEDGARVMAVMTLRGQHQVLQPPSEALIPAIQASFLLSLYLLLSLPGNLNYSSAVKTE